MLDSSSFLLARTQMAFTLGYHIILASFGVGFPVLLMLVEWRYLKTQHPVWKILAKRWAKVFAVLFGVGAVSGTVLSFELGLLWPKFMGTFGGVIGLPFNLEAFAFFLEAIFVGAYLYGWDKLSPRAHWLTTLPIAISGFASAWFVVTANAWMNAPQGFTLVGHTVTDAEPLKAMLNPATFAQTTHMILAAYMVTGFGIASVYAWKKIKGGFHEYHQKALSVALALAVICTPLQMLAGDWSAKVVAQTQPIKLAAMEGQFETLKSAPLRIGGWPNEENEITTHAVEIPGLLSFLAFGDFDATVKGLKEFPREDWPPVLVVHLAFQIMVGLGGFLFLLSGFAVLNWLRKRPFPNNKIFTWMVASSGVMAIVALQAGWVVTEVGRQPWIVYQVMRTKEAVTENPGLGWVFGVTLLIYTVLTIGLLVILKSLAKKPLPAEVCDHV